MICPRCKTEVKDGTSYCPSCGEDLRNIASGKEEETVKEDADSAEKVGTGSSEAEENKASESNEGKEGNESVCPKCGKRVNPGEAFCSSCGAVLSNKAPDFSVNEGEPVKPGNTSAKLLAVLAYLGILVLIPILVAKEDKFVRFHANQGAVLFITEIIFSIIASVLLLIPILGWIVFIAVYIGIIVLTIMGIVNAVSGDTKRLPLIGKYEIIK